MLFHADKNQNVTVRESICYSEETEIKTREFCAVQDNIHSVSLPRSLGLSTSMFSWILWQVKCQRGMCKRATTTEAYVYNSLATCQASGFLISFHFLERTNCKSQTSVKKLELMLAKVHLGRTNAASAANILHII